MKRIRNIFAAVKAERYLRQKVRHLMPSLMWSADDEPTLSKKSFDLVLKAAQEAFMRPIRPHSSEQTKRGDYKFLNVFPGEHYRLLSSIVSVSGAKNVVEIGTSTGMGTYAIKCAMSQPDAKVTTFDIRSWSEFDSHLSVTDFDLGLITQILEDLSEQRSFENNRGTLNSADLIFLDGPKDGVFEYRFSRLLTTLEPKPNKYLILDDIRFLNMSRLWKSIASPKMDLTSFGHWSGTGLVDISQSLRIDD